MKKIKFRAWDTEREVMANVSHIGLNDCEVGMEDEECRCWNTPYPYVCKLMQYTGLKDKNGQEIYEGDILKGTTKWKIDEVLAIAYVKWDRGQFDLFTDAPRGSWEDSLFNYMKFYDVEVLGNIYEDSDLLY